MTSPACPDNDGWYHLDGDIGNSAVASVQAVGVIPKLSITKIGLVTVRHVTRLAALQSVRQLWLWCNVTRRAMRHVIRLPGLTELDVLCIRGPGSLAYFDQATTLRSFRCYSMSESDLICVSQCQTVEEIGAQDSELTHRALAAMLSLPRLRTLDVEATQFDDAMAKRLARSKTISSLDLGATNVSGTGLRALLKMQQLRSLDLWATKVSEDDLPLLCDLPHLEYLSLGNADDCHPLDPKRVVSVLLKLPSLKRVWLDGIPVASEEQAALEAKIESVRITE
ncbi:MAG: hypothetical protein OEY86_11015 [Nitrospira sp.]|nr:hypothetical protein [Nitrospira sp.]